ncbi:MAG: DUF1385 domain-containing protein [Lachnospiraceae bacterium]|nr:DUF1385 domain-containing protein [Lachnospiraceae bacterium]
MSKRRVCYSGIGGQAVLEGIMMKNENHWSVAVRTSDGKIAVSKNEIKGNDKAIWKKVPLVRGVFQFVDSLRLGMKSLNISAEYFAQEEDEKGAVDKAAEGLFGEAAENVLSVITVIFSVAVALGLFMALPYFLASVLAKYVANDTLLTLFEGIIRLVIFLLYTVAITAMKDIRRVYQYHGAEHKCINCLEHGRILDVANVKKSSRFHKRCGTSFLLFVMVVSIILFFFIKVDQVWARLLLRLLLIPVIAGISYEFIRLAGKSENPIISALSAPGLWLQRLTTKEPDDDMIEVAIAAVESVFDWKEYLKKNFDYDVDAYLGLKDYDDADDIDDISDADVEEDTDDPGDIDQVSSVDIEDDTAVAEMAKIAETKGYDDAEAGAATVYDTDITGGGVREDETDTESADAADTIYIEDHDGSAAGDAASADNVKEVDGN